LPIREGLISEERYDFVQKYFIDPLSWEPLESIGTLVTTEAIDAALHRDGMRRHAYDLYQVFSILLAEAIPNDVTVDRQRLFVAFLRSDVIANIPYFDIYSSLHTAAMLTIGYRVGLSDSFDFSIAACVMPNVDAFITDRRLAELIRQSKLDTKFGTNVLAAGDQNIEALKTFINRFETSSYPA
jgi:hypothetical protein